MTVILMISLPKNTVFIWFWPTLHLYIDPYIAIADTHVVMYIFSLG